MKGGVFIAAFTDRGEALAKRLQNDLGAQYTRIGGSVSLSDWTAEHFSIAQALIFAGAAGIAVRAIAPHIRSKTEDPAVVVVDEAGRFAIPILSGHLGGANALAEKIAAAIGAIPVITTATDLRGVFAVDLWAKQQGMTVLQPDRIKDVSSRLLAGESAVIASPWPIAGPVPQGILTSGPADAAVDFRVREDDALQLVPRVLVLGVGCRRGICAEQIEAVFQRFCHARGICPEAIIAAASVDRKQDEAGLLAFCKSHAWPIGFYSAEELRAAEGAFSASAFVEQTVGVDNVCERSAVLASGGELVEKKYAADGVTFALAMTPPRLDWSW